MTYRLFRNTELVLELVAWYDRTLVHEGGTIVGVVAIHVNTVPMLYVALNDFASSRPEVLTMDVTTSMLVS